MRNALVILAALLASTVFGQTIAKLSIGQSPEDVQRVYGKPDDIMQWANGPDYSWTYDFGEKTQIYVVFNKVTNRINRLVATGTIDRLGIFQTIRGVRLGDSDADVQKHYGEGKVAGDVDVVYDRIYPNIRFTFAPYNRKHIVQRIEVFPTPPKKVQAEKKGS